MADDQDRVRPVSVPVAAHAADSGLLRKAGTLSQIPRIDDVMGKIDSALLAEEEVWAGRGTVLCVCGAESPVGVCKPVSGPIQEKSRRRR